MDASRHKTVRNSNRQWWIHWIATFVAVLLIGVFMIPLLRSHPKNIHDILSVLAGWQRAACILGVCIVFTALIYRLLTPRFRHLRYIRTRPPIWLAWAIAIIILCLIDVIVGLSPGRYVASIWEWLGYGGTSVVVIALYNKLTTDELEKQKKANNIIIPDITKMPFDWPSLEDWLHTDEPAQYDFLGNYSVAKRLKELLTDTTLKDTTRSIGIVGPYGAGKTTIVKWIVDMVEDIHSEIPPPILFSQHSCWGFDSSASAIRTMLTDGIKKVAYYIDTFQVGSLPESYRQMFLAEGKWFKELSNLVFRYRDPIQQFHALSDLLEILGARLVFIVEDLDRNNSQTFDIQDVLAFLQRLKDIPNLSFILTGGLKSFSRIKIDYAKLCDHIEYLKTISIEDSAAFICCLRNRCLNDTVFPHIVLTPLDKNEWEYNTWMRYICPDEIKPPEAIATLLNTPRSLRHTLAHTYHSWQSLVGEVDWDHLFAINVLRCAAPEALSYVLRYWDRLTDEPSTEDYKKRSMEALKNMLQQDWKEIISEVDWDARAARALINFILPETSAWFGNDRQSANTRLQGIHQERYWKRAINEVVNPNEVYDQTVAREFHEWLDAPSEEMNLINNLCCNPDYGPVWERLANQHWDVAPMQWIAPTPQGTEHANQLLLLSQQVISLICKKHGSTAAGDSVGFSSVYILSKQCVPPTEDNRAWLEGRIKEAMSTSLSLVNVLFSWWNESIVRQEDRDDVRAYVLKTAKEMLTDSQQLKKVVNPKDAGVLQTLVFFPNGRDSATHTDIESWKWLGPILLDALRQRDNTIAISIYWLVASHAADANKVKKYQVDPTVWQGFFGNDTTEIIQLLNDSVGRLEGDDRKRVTAMMESVESMTMPTGD